MIVEVRYGTRVREERLKRGWTQEHLAGAAEITPRTVARIEKNEVQGLESLMAVSAAFGLELKDLAQQFRVLEFRPPQALPIRSTEDLRAAFNRAYHCGAYRTLLMPMRNDVQEDAQRLLEQIFSDLPYMSPDEPEVLTSWLQSVKEPLEELRSKGLEIFSLQDRREVFVGEPGHRQVIENWSTGYYLLVLENSCFATSDELHLFNERCPEAVAALHGWLRQSEKTETNLFMFFNELLAPEQVEGRTARYCKVCFPNGPTGERITEEYLQRITGMTAEQVRAKIKSIAEA